MRRLLLAILLVPVSAFGIFRHVQNAATPVPVRERPDATYGGLRLALAGVDLALYLTDHPPEVAEGRKFEAQYALAPVVLRLVDEELALALMRDRDLPALVDRTGSGPASNVLAAPGVRVVATAGGLVEVVKRD